ncbi:MAG: energy transducer TonB [Clostridia bacterium]|nr:energy transducer TonB [Deltaproteobacteria bacterium]
MKTSKVPASEGETVADIVFARGTRKPRYVWFLAGVIALVFHGGFFAFALKAQPTLEFWASDLASRVHKELGVTQNVIVEPALPPVIAPTVTAQRPAIVVPRVSPAKAASTLATAQPPAEAGQVIATEAAAPADLTGVSFVTGNAKAYAGGKTNAAGKSKDFVATDTPTSLKSAGGRSYAEGIALADADWSCPWPHEADIAEVNRESAVLRVVVDTAGRATSAVIVKDPGLGFGAAAADCARQARFVPAKDAAGKPVLSESSIRVRFER